MLRDWLEKERRSQEWLAEQIGAHQTSVSRWLLGKPPSLELALKLEKLAGIEPEAWVPEPADSTVAVSGGSPEAGDARAVG